MAARIETLIIHLARATARRAQVDALLTATPYPARVIGAVDGREMSTAQRAAVISDQPLFAPSYPFTLSAGEVGCFLSHRAAWQEIVDGGLDAGLILEDDLALVAGFDAAVACAAQNVGDLGYVQFQVREVADNQVIMRGDNVRILQPTVTPLRTSAQMVSRAAAQKLLDLTAQIDRPVDTFLQSHWHTGLHLCCVVPSGVEDRTAQTGGSTISTGKPFSEKIAREWKRAWYRRAVKKRSTNV
ncbi:glycosyltransferase family 25 protein [Roseobacter sp. N2S]|uniref:glycosyltransferase family 25 protein n=1 Tax=Roseobacter sp. N2S TaxID=2663844 RepID=UPI0028570800|nr:glycosyltransferase family 25 protein [Roseobacter sp. N2S]MDR6265973.1 GR25 family glycosyltransferase involved in LPS biosynthesis [Roseobacter sp. N2S]